MQQQLVVSPGLAIGTRLFDKGVKLPAFSLANIFSRIVRVFGLINTRSGGGYTGEGLATGIGSANVTIAPFEAVILDADNIVRAVNVTDPVSLSVAALADGDYHLKFKYQTQFYELGTIAFTGGSADVFGDGNCKFLDVLEKNLWFILDSSTHGNNGKYQVDHVVDDNHAVLKVAFPGATEGDLQYSVGGDWPDATYAPGSDAGRRIYEQDSVTFMLEAIVPFGNEYAIAIVSVAGHLITAITDQRVTNILTLFNAHDSLIPLSEGGTHADLSAAGPGFLYQAALGSDVTVKVLAGIDMPLPNYLDWFCDFKIRNRNLPYGGGAATIVWDDTIISTETDGDEAKFTNYSNPTSGAPGCAVATIDTANIRLNMQPIKLGAAPTLLVYGASLWNSADSAATLQVRHGMFVDTNVGTPAPDGVYFENTGGHWICKAKNGGSTSTVDTGIGISNVPTPFQILAFPGVQAIFKIGGAQFSIIVPASIPALCASASGMYTTMALNSNTGYSIYLDYMFIRIPTLSR